MELMLRNTIKHLALSDYSAYHAPMNCPACKTQMFVMEYDGLELDHCPACEGVWFDAEELALLFDGVPELADQAIAELPAATSDEAARRCPQCRKPMRKVNIGGAGGVLVDVCPRGHGMFFDRGEVAELARKLLTDSDKDQLPARLIEFLGEAFRCDDAANETETP